MFIHKYLKSFKSYIQLCNVLFSFIEEERKDSKYKNKRVEKSNSNLRGTIESRLKLFNGTHRNWNFYAGYSVNLEFEKNYNNGMPENFWERNV